MAAGLDDGPDFSTFRIITDEVDLTALADPKTENHKILEDRLAHLAGFSEMASNLASDLRKQLVTTATDNGEAEKVKRKKPARRI